MNPQRPSWCQTKTCTCLHRLQDKICAGMPGELGRVCVNFKTVGGGVFAYDNVNTGDVQSLRDLVDAIADGIEARAAGQGRTDCGFDDRLIARGDCMDAGGRATPGAVAAERGTDDSRDGGGRAPSGTGAE